MADFEEARFTYLAQFEDFGWIGYLTTQYLVHENVIWVFFSNVELKKAGEDSEDSYRTITINTYILGMAIWGTQVSLV